MKPLKKDRELNEIRPSRKKHEEHHGEGHGWAVSYADLLMVLLCFFIMYFKMEEESPDAASDALARISLAIRGDEGAAKAAPQKKPGTDTGVSDLASILKIEGVRITEHKNHLVIDLEQSSFKSGQYKLSTDVKKQVDDVLKVLEAHKENVMVTVIGHADKKMMRKKRDLLEDNFDLSAARALTVLKYIRKQGFPENRASARAASSFDRDARSVSFEVRLAEQPAKGGA